MLRLMGSAILVAIIAGAALASAAQAKGPYRVVMSGGDLESPVEVGEGIDTRAMFGDGTQIEPPLPYPESIYTLELRFEGVDAAVPSVSTLTYYPAHDGLPAALRTESGEFFAVAEEFESLLQDLLPASSGGAIDGRETGSGTSALWYVVPGLMGVAVAGGAFVAWRVRRRPALGRPTGA